MMILKYIGAAAIVAAIVLIAIVIWCLCAASPDWEEIMKEGDDDEE